MGKNQSRREEVFPVSPYLHFVDVDLEPCCGFTGTPYVGNASCPVPVWDKIWVRNKLIYLVLPCMQKYEMGPFKRLPLSSFAMSSIVFSSAINVLVIMIDRHRQINFHIQRLQPWFGQLSHSLYNILHFVMVVVVICKKVVVIFQGSFDSD